jgi:hypothetical protein
MRPTKHVTVRNLVRLAIAAGTAVAAAALAVPGASATPLQHAAKAQDSTVSQTVTVDGRDSGRTFDGVGAVSGNGSSRLLIDYPAPERSQILDYLFKPDYGASLQILKVEIGADTDSTAGSEPSIERQRGQVDCNAGYEWWLMAQAKERNPNIKFYGLEWGAPGWFTGGFWSQDNVNYLLSWLGCAEQHGFTISYLGGEDESGYNKTFYEELHQALRDHGYGTQVVASDDHTPPDYWAVATDMKTDPAFSSAVDILGEHDICVWRTLYQQCYASQDALDSGKPLWNSEESTEDYEVGAGPLARSLNREYIDARVTANIQWALVASWYGDFPVAGTGLMGAEDPWSGYYDVGPEIWAAAQTTQFAQPGWRYLDGASGFLSNGASYVTLRSPTTGDYSLVAETMDATAPETVRFNVTGGLSQGTVHVWSTDLASTDSSTWFVHAGDIRPADGSFTMTLQPGHVYTLSTTTGQGKGTARSTANPGQQLPLPFRQNFQGLAPGQLAPYFSDVNGAFQAEPCQGRAGTCYAQVIDQAPIAWHGYTEPPATLVGDPRWWGDYEVSADGMLQGPGYMELLGRVDSQQHLVSGYHLRVTDTGAWSLYSEDVYGTITTLASGQASTGKFGVGTWHHLAMRFHGTTITAYLDGHELATVQDGSHTIGQVGFQVSPWQKAQFDNLSVVPTGPAPAFIPHTTMTATATSAYTGNDFGSDYDASNAIDDRVETSWRSDFDPAAPLPQSITLDLHRVRAVGSLTYQPPVTTPDTGTITDYEVELSTDGKHFTQVASGTWPATIATKVANWGKPVPARYVRLVAIAATGCPATAAAAEIDVSSTPITDFGALTGPVGGSGGPPSQFDNLVPQSQMTATATSNQAGYPPSNAIDGSCSTFWHIEYSPVLVQLPQSITLNLGGSYSTDGLTYLPRQDGNHNGNITAYNVYASTDGQTFTKIASGTWASDSSLKWVTWAPVTARYIRLEATAGFNGYASAAELNVGYQP